jgi:hypothetical protein
MKRIVRASLAGLLLFTVSLAISGSLYEIIGRSHDTRRFHERGHLVQAGSIRMKHRLQRTGFADGNTGERFGRPFR